VTAATDRIARPPIVWRGGSLSWGVKTHVMAIVNVTPDSFSGDGLAGDPEAAADRAARSVTAGADLIDLGAESTRPGHTAINSEQELERLLPALRAIAGRVAVPISVDTSKAVVADAALELGAAIVNDVRGFTRDPELAGVVARRGAAAVVMHDLPPDAHGDLISSVVRELSRRLDRVLAAGVAWESTMIDPGFGFGKDWRQNLELLRRLGELRVLGRPILVGMSRKRTIGAVLGGDAGDRLEGTLATTAVAIANGADIVRIHDVRPNVRVARMTDAVVRGAPAHAEGDTA
jgi:dihydropteroate synthase